MSGILDKKKRFIDFVVTSHGKKKISENDFRAAFVSLTDKDASYGSKFKSSKELSDIRNFQIETCNKSVNDVIVYEFDDSGKLFLNDISGSSIVGNKIFTKEKIVENDKTKIINRISTGNLFASNNIVSAESIKRFKSNKFIRTSETLESESNNFIVTPKKHTFVMTNSVPFLKGPNTDAINIDNAEPLMFDDKLAHFSNFKYLPPVNIDGDVIGDYEDLRGTSKQTFNDIKDGLRIKRIDDDYYSQNNTDIDEVYIPDIDKKIKVLNRKPLLDVDTKISKEKVSINFEDTSLSNNILLQIYEKNLNENELIKLDIVDAGQFTDVNDKIRNRKHVYYVGKVFKDSGQNNTFVNLFTIIWD